MRNGFQTIFWQTLPTGGQVHIVTETMWDQLVVPWEGDHDLIHDLRHRKYAVNFELQIRRKSVRELLQIDYGIPLEVPWQPKGRFPKSDVWFLGRRCFKTLRYLEISSGFTCWTRKLTIHTYLSYQCLFISIQYNTIQAYPPSSASGRQAAGVAAGAEASHQGDRHTTAGHAVPGRCEAPGQESQRGRCDETNRGGQWFPRDSCGLYLSLY